MRKLTTSLAGFGVMLLTSVTAMAGWIGYGSLVYALGVITLGAFAANIVFFWGIKEMTK